MSFRQKIRKNFSYFAKESTSAPRKSFQAAKERHNNVQMNLTTVVLGFFLPVTLKTLALYSIYCHERRGNMCVF